MKTLEVHSLSKHFGGLKAFEKIDLSLSCGEILTIIGPNGAGKTSLFNTISGIYKPDSGNIFLNTKNITALAPFEICQSGLARTFQNIRLFKDMTVLENVLIGEFSKEKSSWLEIILRLKKFKQSEHSSIQRAFKLLEKVQLTQHANELARNLPYGAQRRLELARALATKPQVLLLDEPGAGMNPSELNQLIEIILQLRSENLAILLIEHHMNVVMKISDSIVVIDHGEELAKGKPSDISINPQVISAYLGEALTDAKTC
jgi:branched-chain amino acid transport system ATP-binding protein